MGSRSHKTSVPDHCYVARNSLQVDTHIIIDVCRRMFNPTRSLRRKSTLSKYAGNIQYIYYEQDDGTSSFIYDLSKRLSHVHLARRCTPRE